MIYLDNAATSFHKPDCVARAVVEAMQQAGNSGRGSSGEAMEASRIIFDTRCKIAQLFDVEGPECVAFTANATEALNTALFGILHPEREKVHAICTEMDHNSVHLNRRYLTAVTPLPDYILQVDFVSGSRLLLDMKPYLDKIRFRPLADARVWNSAVTNGIFVRFGDVELSHDEILTMAEQAYE